MFGEMQSWLSPEATPLLQRQISQIAAGPVKLAELTWKDSELDIGVEWPEFRTVNQLVIRFSSVDSSPRRGRQFVEFWDGITTRQGRWRTLEDDTILGIPLEIDGRTWTFTFPQRRTCKLRLCFQDQKQVEIEAFEVYGPSKWKAGEAYIEWGHTPQERSYDGSLSMYNGEVLEVRPFGGTQARGPMAWTSTAGKGRTAGIVARVLYTSGMDVDRTIVTVRTKAFDFSFLPGEVVEYQPIDIPDFGVYIRNNSLQLDRTAYRQKNAKTSRIIDAVAKHPEQTLENAHQVIRAKRVTLSFVGVDSNSQKFGVAPDGHLVIGNNDPSYGQQIAPKFAIYFASTEATRLFQEPASAGDFFATENEKSQNLEEGWLPIVATKWSRNEVRFERLDYATLDHLPQPLDESKLMGNELALMISRLTIANDSTLPKTVSYYIKPWKPTSGQLDYGAMPSNVKNAWEILLRANCVCVTDGDSEYAVCSVDSHGRGSLSLETATSAVRYSVVLSPGEQHSIHTVVPGRPLPDTEQDKLRDLPYEQLHASTEKYWKDRLAEGMQVEIPDRHMQNLYNATLQHFLLAMTKDGKRQEHYPNTAMLHYGSIGSESSPIIQSLDMRGLHARAESCLNAWLSFQGRRFLPLLAQLHELSGWSSMGLGGALPLYARPGLAPQSCSSNRGRVRLHHSGTEAHYEGASEWAKASLVRAGSSGLCGRHAGLGIQFHAQCLLLLGTEEVSPSAPGCGHGECQAYRGRGARLPPNDSPSSEGKRGPFSRDSSSRRDVRTLGSLLCGFARAQYRRQGFGGP
jgi:hypothetical protein